MREQWIPWLLFTSLVCLSVLGGLWLHQPRLVVVDMTRAIQRPAERLSHSKLSAAAQQEIMTRFAKQLPEAIQAYGKLHHITVIGTQVLISQPASDITDEIIEQTIARLKHEK